MQLPAAQKKCVYLVSKLHLQRVWQYGLSSFQERDTKLNINQQKHGNYCLFVLGLGSDVNHEVHSLCLTIITVFAEFPGVVSSLCAYVEAV